MVRRKTMIVRRIERTDDRLLLFSSKVPTGSTDEYRLIAPLTCPARVGDVVDFDPFGKNFGWFHSVVKIKEE